MGSFISTVFHSVGSLNQPLAAVDAPANYPQPALVNPEDSISESEHGDSHHSGYSSDGSDDSYWDGLVHEEIIDHWGLGDGNDFQEPENLWLPSDESGALTAETDDDPEDHILHLSPLYPSQDYQEFPLAEFRKAAQVFFRLVKSPHPVFAPTNSCRAVDMHLDKGFYSDFHCCNFPARYHGELTHLCPVHEQQREQMKEAVFEWTASNTSAELGGKALLIMLYCLRFQEGHFSPQQADKVVQNVDYLLNLAVKVDYESIYKSFGFRIGIFPSEDNLPIIIQEYFKTYKQAWYQFLTNGNPFANREKEIKVETASGLSHVYIIKKDMFPIFDSLEKSGMFPHISVIENVLSFWEILGKSPILP